MKAKPVLLWTVLFGLLVVSVPLFAHHGGVAYDMGRKVTLKGTITNFEWTNPHSQVHLDVTDEKGNVAHWDFETQPPSILIHAGWTRTSLKPGDQVTLIASPAKNGSTIGILTKVVLASGEELTPTEK
jgi:di/tripeptidase